MFAKMCNRSEQVLNFNFRMIWITLIIQMQTKKRPVYNGYVRRYFK
jgi:hypothetical protein